MVSRICQSYGSGFLKNIIEAGEPYFRDAVLAAARNKARRLEQLALSQLEDAYQDSLVLALDGRCRDLATYVAPIHSTHRWLRRCLGADMAGQFLRALVRGDAQVSELTMLRTIPEPLPALRARLHAEMRKLIGYMAVVTFNCWRGERKTRLGRAMTAASNPEVAFYVGRPPEYRQFQRMYHTAVLESMLASLHDDTAGLEKSVLRQALLMRYGQEIPLNEVYRLLGGVKLPFSRATLHRRISAVMSGLRFHAAG